MTGSQRPQERPGAPGRGTGTPEAPGAHSGLMDALDAAEVDPDRWVACRVCAILSQLPTDESHRLSGVIATGSVSSRTLESILRRHGYAVSASSLARHKRSGHAA